MVVSPGSTANANSQAAANADGNADKDAKTKCNPAKNAKDKPDDGSNTCKKEKSIATSNGHSEHQSLVTKQGLKHNTIIHTRVHNNT